jgi:hypothetical protein
MYETTKTVDESAGVLELLVSRVGGNDTDVFVQFLTGKESRFASVVSQDLGA